MLRNAPAIIIKMIINCQFLTNISLSPQIYLSVKIDNLINLIDHEPFCKAKIRRSFQKLVEIILLLNFPEWITEAVTLHVNGNIEKV